MNQTDKNAIIEVHRAAFGEAEGEEVAQIATNLLKLPDTISISATRGDAIVGNVLFTPFTFTDHPAIKCQLLTPCGVIPDRQGRGVGRELMEKSIDHLKSIGMDAVFVLGVPAFYPRYGYVPTDKQTPYPELLTIPESWMALELTDGVMDTLGGRTSAVEPLMQPEFWDTSPYE